MTNIQIPNLPAVANLSGAELVEAVQAGSSVKVSLNQLNALFRIGPVSFPLAVDIGGTGTTTSTGTGSVVLSNNPTLVGPSFNIGSFGLGTVGAPSISFTGDTNTGIWSPGADQIAISTAGVQRFNINAVGNASLLAASTEGRGLEIGIGRSGDGDSFVDLIGDAFYTDHGTRLIRNAGQNGTTQLRHRGTGSLQFYTLEAGAIQFLTTNLERMRISATGNVGIGTPSPAVPLDVLGDGLVVRAQSTTSTSSYMRFDGTGTSFPFVGLVDGIGTFGNTDASPIRFNTNSLERMRIDAAGNVGIGTTNPLERLHVNTASGAAGIRISVSDVSYGNLFSSASGTTLNNITAAPLMFGTTNIERMRIDSAGNVGIGTTNPGVNLEIGGSATTQVRVLSTTNAVDLRMQSFGAAGTGTFGTVSNHPAVILSNNLERMRFFTSGGVSINSLTDPGANNLSVTGVGSFGLGTALLPSYTFNGDLNTGMWSPAADTIAFSTNGGERYRVGPLGQLGIAGANFGTTGQTIISGGSGASTAWGTLGLAGGGTGVTTAPAAAAVLMGYTTTVTSTGTTILTNTSSQYQLFTGTLAHTITLPVTSTLTTGWSFHIVNNSTNTLLVQSSGADAIGFVPSQTTMMVTCILTSGTTPASWEAGYTDFGSYTGSGAVVLANGASITNASINNTTIGASTPTTGAFTVGTFNLGAVATPSITFAGDANTGFWSPAADTVAVSTNAAERLRIDSAGVISQPNATSGSGSIVGEQTFRLTADVTAFGPAIGDFFGTNSSISLEASSVYEITIYAVFTKTTAGTATFTLTASSAPTRMVGTYQASPITGIAAGVDTSGFAGSQGATTAAFAATGSLTTGVNHAYQFAVQLQTNAAANFRLQLTQSLGSATPLAGSYYTVKKISATIGTFVA